MANRSKTFLLSACAGAVCGLSLSVGVVTVSADGSGQPVDTIQRVSFERNASGQTFGSELDAATPADAPDLISAWATNGKEGYILKIDLHTDVFSGSKSPEEAWAKQSARNRVIPVYAQDGRTQIGVYEIGPMAEG